MWFTDKELAAIAEQYDEPLVCGFVDGDSYVIRDFTRGRGPDAQEIWRGSADDRGAFLCRLRVERLRRALRVALSSE